MIYFKLTAVNLRNIVEIMRKSTAELSLHFSHFVGNAPNPIYADELARQLSELKDSDLMPWQSRPNDANLHQPLTKDIFG